MSRPEIINPLYVESPKPVVQKNITVARVENSTPGVCPRCQSKMGVSDLGPSMGNQRVYFCNRCRIAEPLPN